MVKINVLYFSTTRNHRLLVFLLAKAPKGTKKALAPRFKVRPVTDSTAKRKELAPKCVQAFMFVQAQTAFRFTPFSSGGCPVLEANGAGLKHDRTVKSFCLVIALRLRALVPKAGHPPGAGGVKRDSVRAVGEFCPV